MQEACPEEILEAPRQGRARWLYRFTGRYAESVSLSVTISGMTINPYQLQRVEK